MPSPDRPITVTAGVLAGYATGALLVLSTILTLVHPPTFALGNQDQQHVYTMTMTAAAGFGAVIAFVTVVVIGVAGVRTLRGSSGWRIALAAIAGWQLLGAAMGEAVSRFNTLVDYPHISGASQVVYALLAIGGVSCLVLLLLPVSNAWFRAIQPTPALRPTPTPPLVAPAGWYPVEAGILRWWDGSGWTEHTAPVPPHSAG